MFFGIAARAGVSCLCVITSFAVSLPACAQWFPAMRDALQFRAKLVPYLYTSARHAYDSGISIVSPLYYHWPLYHESYSFKQQYMLGQDLLIVPVVQPIPAGSSLVSLNVFVPPGEWIDWRTGHVLVGPAIKQRSFTVREVGVYVRSGSVIVTKVRNGQTGDWLV